MADHAEDRLGRQQNDEAYRAIGRYFVAFSRLIGFMRADMSTRLAKPGDARLMGLVFGRAAARAITDSFFAMCEECGEFDEAETLVSRSLKRQVEAVTSRRNAFAHGDWWVGEEGALGMRPIEPIELVRVRPGRRNGAGTSEVLTVDGLDAEAEAIERLTWTVGRFGQLALRLPLFKGDIRVRDVFVAVDGPEGTAGDSS